jgi:hypothetical protein
MQTNTAQQHIPVSQPNMQNHSVGLIYCDYQLPRAMTIAELDKAIKYLQQIQQYAIANNCKIIGFTERK